MPKTLKEEIQWEEKEYRDKLPIENETQSRREQSLFAPTKGKNVDLKRLHPELANEKEFAGISAAELRFAWYYAIYYAKADPAVRLRKSIEFGFWDRLTPSQKKDYLNHKFPDTVNKAIAKFTTYDLDSRVVARFITELTLQNWKILLDIDMGELLDWEDKKKYIDMSKTITSNLPELIRQVESGFGVRETKFDKTVKESYINDFHRKD